MKTADMTKFQSALAFSLTVTTAMLYMATLLPEAANAQTATYAAIDVPLSQAEINAYQANKLATRGNPIQLPVIIDPVVVSINATTPGSGLRLSTADLCRIFNSTVTDYSQLQAPSTTGRSGSITVFVRSESSGTTNIFTSYLATACPQFFGGSYYITAGLNTFPLTGASAGFQRRSGNSGVANAITATVGAIGYSGISFVSPFVVGGGPLTTQLPNPAVGDGGTGAFFAPTNINNTINATTGLTLQTYATNAAGTLYPCVFRVAGLLPTPTTGSLLPITTGYPINGATSILLYTNYNPSSRSAVTGVFSTLLGSVSSGIPFANDAIAQANGSVIVRSGTANSTTNTVLRPSLTSCLNTTNGTLTQVP
jgi:phosphate transport system substrate-binding protein